MPGASNENAFTQMLEYFHLQMHKRNNSTYFKICNALLWLDYSHLFHSKTKASPANKIIIKEKRVVNIHLFGILLRVKKQFDIQFLQFLPTHVIRLRLSYRIAAFTFVTENGF